MNILYIDIDSLRPDHLGCHGYHRRTSPHLDALAAEGLRFSNCYTPDAPCLPSRTAMTTGRFGFHTGVVNHGGARSVMFPYGPGRGFRDDWTEPNWASQLKRAGYHTVAFSPFAERHGAWHWYAGFMEMHNTGDGGMEVADMVSPQVCSWLNRRAAAAADAPPFFMWVNVWDPHTPYRTPAHVPASFAADPLPSWFTEEVRAAHWQKAGPHSPQEVNDFTPEPEWMFRNEDLHRRHPRIRDLQPKQINDLAEARRMFDGYDLGVFNADLHVGRIIARLKQLGLYDNTAIIVSSDHGENLGELWVYGDHQTADQHTHRVPMIVRWPGVTDARAGQCDDRLLYNLDVAAATLELAAPDADLSAWDGRSVAPAFSAAAAGPRRDALVLSQFAWCAQRSARWDRYLCIRTFHDGFHDYPEFMVFDLVDDPHEQHDLAPTRPELVARGRELIADWEAECLASAHVKEDPKETVLAEGGPLHVRGQGPAYLRRLRETGRGEIADRLAAKHGITA